MAVTYGFYDAIDGDRVYNAVEMSSIFDGVINDGVLSGYANKLAVVASSPAAMSVKVSSGRAWFDHTWTYNSAALTLSVTAANATYPRIDIVVLETDKTNRINSFKVVAGEAASSPVAPTPTSTANVKQHVLAHISVAAGATAITTSNITNKIGVDSSCPWATFADRPVDTAINSSSSNPVENRVIYTQLGTKENTSNKVTSISSSSTNTQYPSAKLLYDQLVLKESLSNKVTSISSSSTNTQYPSAKLVYNQLALKAAKASPTFTGTPEAPTAAVGTNTDQIATTAFVQSTKKADDNLAPIVGDVLFNRTTQTTSDLARPFFYQSTVSTTYPMGYYTTPTDSGEINEPWTIVFKNKFCAGNKLKITWHADKTSSIAQFRVPDSFLNTNIPYHWTNYYYNVKHINLDWPNIVGSTSAGGNVTANQTVETLFDIPSENYPDSFVYCSFSLSKSTGSSSSTNFGIYIDKVEIVS